MRQYKQYEELSLGELYSILELRQEVFVVEQECYYQDADGKDQGAGHLMYFDGDMLVAYARILPPGQQYNKFCAIGRILTKGSQRGKGLGKQLVSDAIEICRTNWPQCGIRISAQTYLLKFYGSFGFRPVGKEYLEDGIPHVDMELTWRVIFR